MTAVTWVDFRYRRRKILSHNFLTFSFFSFTSIIKPTAEISVIDLTLFGVSIYPLTRVLVWIMTQTRSTPTITPLFLTVDRLLWFIVYVDDRLDVFLFSSRCVGVLHLYFQYHDYSTYQRIAEWHWTDLCDVYVSSRTVWYLCLDLICCQRRLMETVYPLFNRMMASLCDKSPVAAGAVLLLHFQGPVV